MRRRWSPRCRRREPARPLTRGRTYDVQQSRTHRALEFLESPCTNLTHRALPCCPAMRGTWRPFCYYTQWAVPRRRRQHQPCVSCLFTFAYERRSSDLTLPLGPCVDHSFTLWKTCCIHARLPRTMTTGRRCIGILGGARRTSSRS